uniref:Ig-like domain-containing protein n=1 Tax=Biomphalaria glabrata TaxID=6526 RepID=A0A2C9JQ02_BIOGL
MRSWFELVKEIEPTPNRGGDDRDNSTEYTTIQLHGNIHKCTITGLKPLTTYEVCLVYKKIHPMQCSNYTTTQEVEVLVSDGIVRISKSQIGLGFAVVLGIVVLVVVLLLVRRARRRKDYQGPLADEEKASIPLSDNKLLALQHGTFNGLDSLRVLDLSRNGIRRVETHSFAGLTDLEVLNLKNNQLYQLERGWLLPLTSLQRLYLSDNKISSLDDGVFAKLPELQHLDLSNNMIREVPDNAFSGLRSLNLLNFTGNSNMKEVPTKSLQPLPTVNILLLDGLAMSRLRSFAVGSIDVVELSISYTPKLQVIEKAAFHNLSSLTSLQLHDNPRLVYIHPASFASVPRLRHLHLHNNGLVSVSSQLVTSLPSLYDLHLHHNRFFCDCNIYWLRKELSLENPRSSLTSPMTSSTDDVIYTLASTGTSSPRSLVSEPQRVSCYFQSGSPEMSLMQLPMEYFSPMCPPTVLAMFPADISLTIGEELWLECHGLGVPAPSLSWVLPGGREINATSNFVGETNFSLTEVLQDSALLHIKPVSLSDSGTYGCRAVNSISEETKTTQVRVQNKPLSISDVRVGNDYITLAWRGAIPRVQMSDFQLF